MQSLHTPDAAHAASMSVVEKTDDLISALQLVRAVFAAGNVAANAPAATGREPTTDELAAPGLLETLEAHRLGCERFNTATFPEAEADTWVAQTYGPHFRALKEWRDPACSAEEAIAALQYASNETGCEIAKPMIDAVLGYLKLAGSSMDYLIERQRDGRSLGLMKLEDQLAAKDRFWSAVTTNYSLTEAMAAYELGREQFVLEVPRDGDPGDELERRTYGLPMEALRAWDRPARNVVEATSAFEIGLREIEQGDRETGLPLVNAAIAFMKSLGGTSPAPRPAETMKTTEEVQRAFGAMREMQSIARLARLAIDERVTLFQDFETIDTKEPISFVEDLHCALGLVDRQASEAIDLVNQVLYRAYGLAGRG